MKNNMKLVGYSPNLRNLALGVLMMSALGCAKDPVAQEGEAPKKPNGVLTQAQKDALEKAKDVEKTLQEGQEKLQQQLDKVQ